MGRSCAVPCCVSNHGNQKTHVNTFSFPKDEAMKAKWLRCINRENFIPNNESCVCILHFDPQFVSTTEQFKDQEGNVVCEYPRKRPKLAEGAYPTIFTGQPSYLSSVVPKQRTDPNHRSEQLQRRDQLQFQKWMENDRISTFQDFKEGLKTKDCEPFIIIPKETYVLFVRIEDSYFTNAPTTGISFKISNDLNVNIFKGNTKISTKKYKAYLSDDLKCKLWSSFDNLLSTLRGTDVEIFNTVKESIEIFAERMDESLDFDVELQYDALAKIKFLTEQLMLAVTTAVRYSPQMLVWAATIYYMYPGAYRRIRESKKLTLPHPSYLQKLLCKIGNNEAGIGPAQEAFLKEKFKLLDENDKTIALLFDEIYVRDKITYKGGQVYGIADAVNNSSDITAGTIQAFMSSSLRSKNKDVIALFPVRNLTGPTLHSFTLQVLKLLHEVGFFVLSLVCDNNQTNVSMYTLLSGGETGKIQVPNPFDPEKPLFLLFDKSHLFKNFRNNWINKLTLKIPICPQFDPLALSPLTQDDSKAMPCQDDSNDSNVMPQDDSNAMPQDDSNAMPRQDNSSVMPQDASKAMPQDASNAMPQDDFNAMPQDDSNANNKEETIELQVYYYDARWSDLRDLFHAEQNRTLKLGPKLSRKSVFPSSIDRQNVTLVHQICNDSTIVGLETLKKNGDADISEGTIYLEKLFSRWWKISNVSNPFKGKRLNDMWCEPIYGVNDVKLQFLRDFATYLEIWKLSEFEDGKLTHQTCDAFLQTIRGVIALCEYIFENLGWKYVLIGTLSTDLLEGEFGCYRRMSGDTYHVHVEQVLESARKLSLVGVLKLNSAKSGEFSITKFVNDCKKAACEKEKKEEEDLVFFEEAIFERRTVTVTGNDQRVLIVLSSYAATKFLQQMTREKKIPCQECKNSIVKSDILEVHVPAEFFDYFSGLDRGGLYKPSDFSFDICVNTYRMFQILISKKYEEAFLKLRFQRKAIVRLGLKLCEMIIEDFDFVCEDCNLTPLKISKKVTKIMANILMNNYIKTLNDTNTARQLAVKMDKKRKKEEKAKQKREAEALGKAKDPTRRKIVKLSSS